MEEIGTDLSSTEELCSSLQESNQGPRQELASTVKSQPQNRYPKRPRNRDLMQNSTLVIGSMDIESLYPSCKAKGIGMSVRTLEY